jgi:phosphoglycolate phosphatase-like HAD superfamily hydrolase
MQEELRFFSYGLFLSVSSVLSAVKLFFDDWKAGFTVNEIPIPQSSLRPPPSALLPIPRSGDFHAWPKAHDIAVAVDWDGTCKDTMVPKWTRGFNSAFTRIWPALLPHQAAVDKACWDINLVEHTAGVPRFVGLKLIMARLASQGLPVPEVSRFVAAVDFVEKTGEKHAMETYRRLQARFGYDDAPLAWSDESDRLIAEAVKDAKVFDNCHRVLDSFRDKADLIVVSASKTEAVLADLKQDGMAYLFKALLAQDFLTKKATLAGLKQRYSRVMFIGDTQHDLHAGQDNGVPVFLVKVGDEGRSWIEAEGVLAKFVAGG